MPPPTTESPATPAPATHAPATRPAPDIRAVFWDFGGVILTSPFEAFNRYEAEAGLPPDTIRTLNATNPDANAWARFERNEVDRAGFAALFEAEAAEQGHRVDAQRILASLDGAVRPAMVVALQRLKAAGFALAMLTNNISPVTDRPTGTDGPERSAERDDELAAILALFDAIVESSRVGVRKPEPRFYELALEAVGVKPHQTVFLDDLGINLKPAAAMGIHTIKVTDPDTALAALEAIVGITLRDSP